MLPATRLYVATIAEDAVEAAARFGSGLEIGEFCTAANMDEPAFFAWDASVCPKIEAVGAALRTARAVCGALPDGGRSLVREVAVEGFSSVRRLGLWHPAWSSIQEPRVYWGMVRGFAFWREFCQASPPILSCRWKTCWRRTRRCSRHRARGDDPRLRLPGQGHAFAAVCAASRLGRRARPTRAPAQQPRRKGHPAVLRTAASDGTTHRPSSAALADGARPSLAWLRPQGFPGLR